MFLLNVNIKKIKVRISIVNEKIEVERGKRKKKVITWI